jgi:hypothetical protein
MSLILLKRRGSSGGVSQGTVDSTVATAIATEVTNRNAADTSVIATEVTNRNLAIDTGFQDDMDTWAPTDDIEPGLHGGTAGNSTTAPFSANDIILIRFRLRKAITCTGAKIYHGATVAGNIDVGIYSFVASPALLAHSGDALAAGASQVKKYTFLSSLALAADTDYYFSIGATDATMTIMRQLTVAAVGSLQSRVMKKASAYSAGLTTPISTPAGGTCVPWFALTTT